MENQPKGFENYPAWIVIVMNLVTFISYGIGAYILFRLGVAWGFLYVLYILYVESTIYREGCKYCYYYGKVCAWGRGKIAALFIKKGDPKVFCERKVTFVKLLPQLLGMVFPLIGGIILLCLSFSWLIVGLMIIPWLIWFLVYPITFGKLACPNCKQGSICCPANDFFSGKTKRK
ncbi:MAG: hypothetical protein KKB81_06860 [Candidatus Margulisbacteria bacterium]|nr:hypothetical protein [Candidatus Margulisiibacteriota bacterium]MBU1022518.1 hypothetical protein [Candidatus Margulisiibacteriota bacterium]MBU1728502.1 hypothetical protein [Candidatus Margulisiibacteriota bacterium]MBU1954649.1 hypothetical protein [Candidatus Margulisiibacteriota bacterium]